MSIDPLLPPRSGSDAPSTAPPPPPPPPAPSPAPSTPPPPPASSTPVPPPPPPPAPAPAPPVPPPASSPVPPPPPPRSTAAPPPPPTSSAPAQPPPPPPASSTSAPRSPSVPFPAITPTDPPPPPIAPDDDLQDLLDRLHEDLELGDQTPIVPLGSATTKPTNVTRPSLASDVVIESGDGIAFQPTFASFGARLLGLVIDIVVLTVFCLPGIAAIALGSGTLVIVFGAIALFAGFGAATVFYAKGVSGRGQSIGNRLTGTRVVDARNGHLVPAGEAGTRYVVRMLISMILFVGFLMALGNSQRRTFHDNIAGTVVIRPTRASWSIDDEMEQ